MCSPGVRGGGWGREQPPLRGCAGVRRGRSAGRVEMYRLGPERRVRARGATAGGVALVYLLPTLPVRVPLRGRYCSPCPPPPSLRPGWYREDVGKWQSQPGTYTPDPQISDIAAPALTKHRCSPSPGSPAAPRPRQWHLPGLTSFLPLPLLPTHAPAERHPPASSPPGCRLVAPSGPFPPIPEPETLFSRPRDEKGSAWRFLAVTSEDGDVCETGRKASLWLPEAQDTPHTQSPATRSCPFPKRLGSSYPLHLKPSPRPRRQVRCPRPEPPLALPSPGPEPPAATSGSSSRLPRSESRLRSRELPPGAGWRRAPPPSQSPSLRRGPGRFF